MQVTIVRPGGIGDSLLSWPSLRAIRCQYPDAKIIFYGAESAGAILRRVGLVDAFADINEEIGQTDYLIAFDYLPSLRTGEMVRKRVSKRVHYADFLHPPGEHQGKFMFREMRRALPLPPIFDDTPVSFPVPDSIVQRYADAICLSPGSSDQRKIWPHFGELARALRDQGHRVVWLEPHKDAGSFEIIKDTFLNVARIAAASRLVIGNDSSIAHFCGFSGARAIALFGPTSPLHWAPLGGSVTVLEGCPRLAGPLNHAMRIAAPVIACTCGNCFQLLPMGAVLTAVRSALGAEPDAAPGSRMHSMPKRGVTTPRQGG